MIFESQIYTLLINNELWSLDLKTLFAIWKYIFLLLGVIIGLMALIRTNYKIDGTKLVLLAL